MEIAILIIFLFTDILVFDQTHEYMGLDETQPIISMGVEQICEAGDGVYTKWGDDAGCAGFTKPE